MKNKKKNNGQGASVIILLVYVVVGVICGKLTVRYMDLWAGVDTPFLLPGAFALLILMLFISIFLQTVIHESGHLVFGLLSGYRFSSFRVGSAMLLRKKGQLVWKRYSLAGTGGQCLMAPPEPRDGKFPVFLYNMGGSVMNLLASAVFLCLYAAVPFHSPFAPFFMMCAAWGTVFALTNGIPMRIGAVDNDGRNALSLKKDPAALRAFWLQLRINEEIVNEIRLKDMPDAWFSLPGEEETQNSLLASQAVLCCNRLVDQGRFQEAADLLDRLLARESGMIGLHRALASCDRIYLELIGQNRKEVLDNLLTDVQRKSMKSMKKCLGVIRTEYAYALLAQKDTAKAGKLAACFEKVAKTYPYHSEVESEQELMALAEKSAKEMQI